MMSNTKRAYTVFLVFLVGLFGLQAQTKVLKGTVIDSQSRIGIEGVTISTAEGNDFTITNSEGDFLLSIDEQVESVWFNHMNYAIKEVSTKAAMLIELDLINKELEEIIVLAKPFSTVFNPVLERTIEATEKGDLYQTYVRAFNLVNNDLSNVADGLVDFYIVKPNKNPQIDVKQNRVLMSSKDLTKESEMEEVLGIIDSNVNSIIINTNNIERLQSILKNEKEYEYVMKKRKGIQGEETYVVEFSPKENLKGWKYYEGHIVFTADQEHLIEYHYGLAKSYEKNRRKVSLIFMKMFMYDSDLHAVYREQDGEYRLSYLSSRQDLGLFSKKIGDHRLMFSREVIVDNKIKHAQIPPTLSKKRKTLFSMESNYQTEFWKNRNIRLLTSREQKTLEILEGQEQLK